MTQPCAGLDHEAPRTVCDPCVFRTAVVHGFTAGIDHESCEAVVHRSREAAGHEVWEAAARGASQAGMHNFGASAMPPTRVVVRYSPVS